MQTKRTLVWPAAATLSGVILLFIALPDRWKTWAPLSLRKPAIHFGLDLAGGTQLDFRISEQEINDQIARLNREIEQLKEENASAQKISIVEQQLYGTEQQKASLVEAIRTVLERRINSMGVSEAIITPSYYGTEKHLLVECPGVRSVQECIATVGKTIQLEFKEEFTEPTAEFEKGIRQTATSALRRITESGSSLQVVGEDFKTALGVSYSDHHWYFKSDLPTGLENVWKLARGKVTKVEGSIDIQDVDESGQPIQRTIPGIFLTEVLTPRTQTGHVVNEAPKAFSIIAKERKDATYSYHENTPLDAEVEPLIVSTLDSMSPGELKTTSLGIEEAALLFLRQKVPGQENMAASHILIAYKGAMAAGENVTRMKDEALTLIQDLREQIVEGADFAALAKKYSDDPTGKKGGDLGTFTRGMMVPSFEAAAFSLAKGAVSDPVETQFGYHLIRADRAASTSFTITSFDELRFTGTTAKVDADAVVSDLRAGKVTAEEDAIELRTLFFSLLPTGWKDTELDGKHFRSAVVTMDPTTNMPVVQIAFDDEGGKIFQELTKKNVGKRIAIFVGGDLVSAPVVQQEIAGGIAIITGSKNFEEAKTLAQDLNTGAIPAPIYLAGQHTIEATLGGEALHTSLKAALVGIIILMIYMIIIYRFLGFLADIALSIYALLFLVILKLPLFLFTSQYIVLTVAGMAGIILSIGMAVDANVLIFERVKEEIRKGKMLQTAMNIGFKRAWPSIRDGNASTLITCAVLFMIGTSIVRGFAITLSMGVLMSMFTAITVTRWLINKTAHFSFAQNTHFLLGVRGPSHPVDPFHA